MVKMYIQKSLFALACSTEVAQTEPSDRLIKATRADRSPKKSLVAKAVPVVFSGPTTPDP